MFGIILKPRMSLLLWLIHKNKKTSKTWPIFSVPDHRDSSVISFNWQGEKRISLKKVERINKTGIKLIEGATQGECICSRERITCAHRSCLELSPSLPIWRLGRSFANKRYRPTVKHYCKSCLAMAKGF